MCGARAPALARGGAGLVDVLVRQGREGRDPGAAERRRLLLAGAFVAFLVGAALAGPLPGLALAAGGPWAVSRVLRARRRRYRRAVDAGVAAGLPWRWPTRSAAAIRCAGRWRRRPGGVSGAAGHELRRAAAELSAGATTEEALEAMRARVRLAPARHTGGRLPAAARAGGDLGRLLRESARAMEDQARLEDEVRAATAQARFTGLHRDPHAAGRRAARRAGQPRVVCRPLELVPDRLAGGPRHRPAGTGRLPDAPARAGASVSVAAEVALAFVAVAAAVAGLVLLASPLTARAVGGWRRGGADAGP